MNMPANTRDWRGVRAFVTYASATGIDVRATGLKLNRKPVRKLMPRAEGPACKTACRRLAASTADARGQALAQRRNQRSGRG